MSKVTIPAGYKTPLSTYEMQRAIEFIKSNFQVNLGQALNLRRVSAPLFVEENSGLNDNLNGVERPVSFDIPDVGAQGQVVHSLAKWKRLALKRYDFKPGKGLFTDMNAIRRDEEVDNLHSVYVDQWDWEKVIERRDRNVAYLEQTVRAIVGAVVETNDALQIAFPSLHTKLDREVFFVTTQELEDRWPDYTPKQREDAICKEHHTVFLMQIGDDLKRSGKPHDGRAPDYDDWSLNGDILMYNPVLDRAFEISSMGIRVDEAAMDYQLHKRGCDDRRELPFHKMLLAGQLPLTIGGGIGQSRLCMLMIGTCHIGKGGLALLVVHILDFRLAEIHLLGVAAHTHSGKLFHKDPIENADSREQKDGGKQSGQPGIISGPLIVIHHLGVGMVLVVFFDIRLNIFIQDRNIRNRILNLGRLFLFAFVTVVEGENHGAGA